jgi:DNA excision repair protein ERCC-8
MSFSSYFDAQIHQKKHSSFHKVVRKNSVVHLKPSLQYEVISEHDTNVQCLSIDGVDSRFLLSGAVNGTVSLFDLEKYKASTARKKMISPVKTVHASNSIISSVHWFTNDCGLFLTSSFDGTTLVFDANAMESVLSFKFESSVSCSQFSPHSNTSTMIATALANGSIRLCDIVSGDYIHTIHAHTNGTTSVDWSPLKEYELASASKDGSVKCWDIRKIGSTPLLSLDWLRDDTYRRSSQAGYVKDVKTKTNLIQAHSAEVMSLRYSSCGKYLLSCGNDSKIRLWSSQSGLLLPKEYSFGKFAKMPFRMEFISNLFPEDILLFPLNQEITLTPLQYGSGDSIYSLNGHFDKVSAAVYRSSTSEVISAGRDGLLLYWDATDFHSKFLSEKEMNKAPPATRIHRETVSFITEHLEPKNKFLIPILSQYMKDAQVDQLVSLNGKDNQRTTTSSSSVTFPNLLPPHPASSSGNTEINWNDINSLFDTETTQDHEESSSSAGGKGTTGNLNISGVTGGGSNLKRKPSVRDDIERRLKKKTSK